MGTKIIPVVLAGGSGKRLWPLSRECFPKQYINIDQETDKTLLQNTFLRLKGINNLSNPIIICNEDHRFIVAEQMKELNIKPRSILLEPFGRNTAPAIISAALKGSENGCDPTLLILSADHKIESIEQFLLVINKAMKYCNEGKVVTFGVVPTSPEIGYGYINASVPLENILKAYPIEKFIEKPNLETAEQLIKDKKNYWNSGIFMAKSSTLIGEAKKYCKGLTSICKDSLDSSMLDLDFQRINNCLLYTSDAADE